MSTPSTPLSATARLVPGAPPPAPGSKTQKRKKTKSKKPSEQGEEHTEVPDVQTAALITQAPSEGDVKEGAVAPELIVRSTSTRPVSPSGDDKDPKVTALVDMLNKRLKATNKKVIRIQGYSTWPPDKLNEDQVRSLKTLPVLEGIVKELEEVKKAVEVHEAEVALEVSKIKAEAAKAEEERVQDAVASAISLHRLKTADLLSLITLHTALTNGNPTALALNLSETEAYAVFSAVESLLGSDSEKKAEVIRGFLSAEGEYQGVSYARLIGITELFTHPPPPAEPEAPEPEVVVEFVAAEEPAQELEVVIQGVPASAGVGGSFTFVQEDELEVEQEEAEPSDDDVEIIQTVTEADVAGHHIVQESLTITTTHEEPAPVDNAGINWADEEDHGLPSIASLHDRFGSSSTGTPVPGQEPLPETPITPAAPHGSNTEDGFQHASRGRGRGRGGFRGGERGGYRGFRGGERGGFRGGERGGRGGWRGGDRGGERGGWRGRGRGEGDWRGGDGEHRGRGRGRGRGGFHDARGGGAPPPVAA